MKNESSIFIYEERERERDKEIVSVWEEKWERKKENVIVKQSLKLLG